MNDAASLSLDFVGDVHLEEGDAAVADFISFLGHLGGRCGRLVLLGDLFNLWIGRRELERPHQTAVLNRLTELRRQGVVVRYMEGNRDYRIHRCYAGTAIDDASDRDVVERFGGRTISVAHGDLVNREDRQYRLWRSVSRSAPVWGLYRLLPRALKARLADSLEHRMRASNLAFKQGFPDQAVRRYAERIFSSGADTVVLGHFHVEKDMRLDTPGRSGRVLVLPEWKGARRHLRVEPDGAMGFVDSPF